LRSVSDHKLGDFLAEQGCDNSRKVMRRRGWTFPELSECRKKWEERFPGWKWRNPNLKECSLKKPTMTSRTWRRRPARRMCGFEWHFAERTGTGFPPLQQAFTRPFRLGHFGRGHARISPS
jgi:hypothetical protein